MVVESKNNDAPGGDPGLVGMLEKPWLFVWTLRVLIVTLSIDLALVATDQKSLLLKGLTTSLLSEPGIILLATCAFGVYVCMVAPATLKFFRTAVWVYLPSTIPYRAAEHSQGFIRAYRVRERAMTTENQFWLSLYDEHARKTAAARKAARTVALLLWTALILALAQIALGVLHYPDAALLAPKIFRLPGGDLENWAILLLVALAVLWAIVACLDLSTHDAPMYCPPYAAEEYRKEREAQQRRREFDERLQRDIRQSKGRHTL
ncbi:hypothetical protein [Achromobacter aegrifaciens]